MESSSCIWKIAQSFSYGHIFFVKGSVSGYYSFLKGFGQINRHSLKSSRCNSPKLCCILET